jgi:Flp pilus assembly protein TadD
MSDSKKSEHIVVDRSVLEGLFGTATGPRTPEAEPETDAGRPSDVPVQSTPPEPERDDVVLPEAFNAEPAPALEEDVASAGDESVYDSESLLSRALMLDVGSDPPSVRAKSEPPPARRVEPVQAIESVPEAPGHPAAESQVAPEGRSDDPAWQHARGNQQFSNGDYSDAEESYRRVLKIAPDSWSAHFNLGMVMEQLTRLEEALAEYGEARRIDGTRIEAAARSGCVELRLGEYEDALASFRFVLAVDPQNSRALFGKGAALQGLEKLSQAKECYESLLKDHPENGELLGNLAVTSLALKDYPRTLECAAKMAEVSEEPECGLRLQIECAVAQGDDETAAQHSAQLVEMVEGSYEAWFNLGVACQHTGRLEVAVDAYKQALTVEPDRPEAQVNLGAVLHESENLVEARQFYEEALVSGTADHPGVNWNLGLAAESLGAFDVAEKAYAVTVRNQPQWKEAVGRLTRLNPSHDAAQ